uniref:Uncharacterized protein n=1 Tax=Arundo donax TaxID=35708 RepID=A0A0A9G137_ARUDO
MGPAHGFSKWAVTAHVTTNGRRDGPRGRLLSGQADNGLKTGP